MRLFLHFLSWRAVAVVEQGVAEGLGWVFGGWVFFLLELTRVQRVKSGFTGFFEIVLSRESAPALPSKNTRERTPHKCLLLLALISLRRENAVAQWQSTSATSLKDGVPRKLMVGV